MKDEQLILKLIQSHKELEHFDYSKAVDWAIDLIGQGNETDNVSRPIIGLHEKTCNEDEKNSKK